VVALEGGAVFHCIAKYEAREGGTGLCFDCSKPDGWDWVSGGGMVELDKSADDGEVIGIVGLRGCCRGGLGIRCSCGWREVVRKVTQTWLSKQHANAEGGGLLKRYRQRTQRFPISFPRGPRTQLDAEYKELQRDVVCPTVRERPANSWNTACGKLLIIACCCIGRKNSPKQLQADLDSKEKGA
jgi:hypothetical protein